MKDLKWFILAMSVSVLSGGKAALSDDCTVGITSGIRGVYQGTDNNADWGLDETTTAGPTVIVYKITVAVPEGFCPISRGEVFLNLPDGTTVTLANKDLVLNPGESIEYVADSNTYTISSSDLGHLAGAMSNEVRATIDVNALSHRPGQTQDTQDARNFDTIVIRPATRVEISASPMHVVPIGTDVELTITEENTGDANLADPYVELEPLGLILDKVSDEYFGGDADGDGELDPGEIWTWVVDDNDVNDTKAYWAVGHGIDPLGNDVTWCENSLEPPADTLCDANEANEVTVERINPATLVGISASPTEVSPVGTDVTLTITEENTGDCNLTDPYVVLGPLGLTLLKGSPQYDSGDTDGDGELDIDEEWTWIVVDSGVDANKTYTTTGHGTDPLGNDVTWCENPVEPPENTYCDPNERAQVTVARIRPATLVDISAEPMEVSPMGTDVNLTITEENIGDCNLTDPCVVLEPLNLTLTKGPPEYVGGDNDDDGELDPGEIWTWVVIDGDVNDMKTYTAIGHGTDPRGNDVTWCENPADPPADTLCDANEQDVVTVSLIYCGTLVGITASPMDVSPVGTDVNLTITEENSGDCNLTDPYVELEPLGLVLDKSSLEYSSGDDDGDGKLDPGEIWTWVVIDRDVNDTRTYTVTGYGTDPLGNEVTWCENPVEPPEDTYCDPNERAQATVDLLYCSTLVHISAEPMEVSPMGTDVDLTITEENIGDCNLTDPCVALEPLGLMLDKDSPYYQSGDVDDNNVLDVGEMWTWVVVDQDVCDTKVYTAIGRGIDPLGNDVTWCLNPQQPPADTLCDANERDEETVGVIYCGTLAAITALPMQVTRCGTDVTLMIGEENTGDANLTDPYVELEPLGLVLDRDSPHYVGGDTDDYGVLNVGETWIWAVIDQDVNYAKTYTVFGHGTDPLGNDVTWCEDSLEPPEDTYCDANERHQVTVAVLYCSTVLDISASPMQVSPLGTDVTLTITEENIGDSALTDPCVVLEPLGLIMDKDSPYYQSGDVDGNDVLDPGETWTWIVVDAGVNTDKTYTAVGHGTNAFGNDVTWCSNPADPPANTICDANERDQVEVNVMNCDTVVDISASPMQVSGAADVTLTVTEENAGDVDLTDPCVVLEPLGLTLTKGSSEYTGGDTDADGELDAGETWTWIIIDPGVDSQKTYTVVGHGTDTWGNDVTWCSNPDVPPANTLCDQDERDEVTVERIGGGATRTPGFWKTHVNYTEHIFNVHCGGLIDLGWVVVDSNADIFGVFWANKSRNTNGSRRSDLCQARIHASFHALAAILNSCLHNGAPLPKTRAEIAAILGGTDRSAIIALAGQLGAYNESGDNVTIIDNDGFTIGNADPAAAKARANYAVADCLSGTAASKKTGKGKK